MSHASRLAEQLRMAADDEDTPEEEGERLRKRADELESDNDNETMSETDNTDETESTEEETPIGTEFDVPPTGMLALDRTDLEGNRCVVIAHHNTRAGDFTVAATGKTIAEHQSEWEDEEWAEDVERAPVVDVAYKGRLEERWDEEWQEWPASLLTYRVGNEGMRTYSFPVSRLLFGPEYAEVITEQGREPADTTSETPADPGVVDVACKECEFEAAEGDTKADYAVHFEECPECGGDLHGRLVDAEEGDLVTDGGLFEARTEGMAFDGVEVDLTTRATESGADAEDKAEKVHMDLKARFQRLAQAYEEGQHPDEGTPFMSVDWESVLGLTEEDNE